MVVVIVDEVSFDEVSCTGISLLYFFSYKSGGGGGVLSNYFRDLDPSYGL